MTAIDDIKINPDDAPAMLSKLVDQFCAFEIDYGDIPADPEMLEDKTIAVLKQAADMARRKDFKQAYDIAKKHSGESFEFDYLRGKILFAHKCYYEAAEAFLDSIIQFDGYGEAWFFYGMCEYQTGLTGQAFMGWYEAYRANKNHEDAKLVTTLTNSMIDITHKHLNPDAVSMAPIISGKGIDVGCGGNKTHPDAIGVDIIAPGKTGEEASQKNVVSQADIEGSGDDLNMFSGDELDYVVARHNLEHYVDPVKALLEWRRVLKPSGVIGLVLPDDDAFDTIHSDKTHTHVFTRDSLRNMVSIIPGLEIVEMGTSINKFSFYAILEKTANGEKPVYQYRRKAKQELAEQAAQRAKIALLTGITDVAAAACRKLGRLAPDVPLPADPDALHPFPFAGREPLVKKERATALKVAILDDGTCASNWANALSGSGHSVVTVPFENKDKITWPIEKRFWQIDPDFVMTAGFHPYVAGQLANMNIPYVCWIAEVSTTKDIFSRRDPGAGNTHIFHFSKKEVERCTGLGVRNIVHLPLAADMEPFTEPESKPEYVRDINIVESASQVNGYSDILSAMRRVLMNTNSSIPEKNEIFKLTRKFGTVIDRGGESLALWRVPEIWEDVAAGVNTACVNLSDSEICFALGDEISARQRKTVEKEVSGLHVNLQSGAGTVVNKITSSPLRGEDKGGGELFNTLPSSPPLKGGGKLENYSNSKINLYMNKVYNQDGIPIEVFNVMACGGFLMTDYREAYNELFEIGKDLVCFHSIKEACEMAEYYLSHPDERKAIAQSGRRKVTERHTLKQRYDTIIETLQGRGVISKT